MANAITKFKNYVTELDEVYKVASLTSVLDSDSSTVQQGANVEEIIIPKIDMDGLADYDRSNGYATGDVTFTNETVKCNYERGRMFVVDSCDNEETAGLAFGKLSGEFIRTKVVPEVDAVRFAEYSVLAGSKATPAAIAAGKWYEAVSDAMAQMTDDEVPTESRYLFITSEGMKDIRNMNTTESKAFVDDFAGVIVVPKSRFYTAIDLASGNAGGYSKSATGKNINFLIVEKSAVIQFFKHVAPKVVTPDANPDADAWKFGYRVLGLNDAYDNKTKGIYLHASNV